MTLALLAMSLGAYLTAIAVSWAFGVACGIAVMLAWAGQWCRSSKARPA